MISGDQQPGSTQAGERGPTLFLKAKGISPSIANPFRVSGTPEGIRTPDLRIRSPLLYPSELQALYKRQFKNPVYHNPFRSSSKKAMITKPAWVLESV
jgi:hypothetical protein